VQGWDYESVRELAIVCKASTTFSVTAFYCDLALKTTGMPKDKVMGMGGLLDLSRFKSFVRERTHISSESIHAMVIIEHGENMLPLIRFSCIGGIPLNYFITDDIQSGIFENTRKAGADLIALKGATISGIFENTRKAGADLIALKGATIYAPGNAVATMVEAILKDKKSLIPVSAPLDGEYGANNICIGVPVILGEKGMERIIELKLNSLPRIFR
jgi:malate dehydrogenase